MRVLITGGTGLLGKALIDTAKIGHKIIATYLGSCEMEDASHVKYAKLDTRDKEGNKRLFKSFKPDVTIHAAGIGSPDYAERYKEQTREINIGGTRNVVRNCDESGSKFIYISSNAIYDGAHAPYDEEHKPKPINYYGRIKLEGESIAGKAGVRRAIVRPILMYGWGNHYGRPNIVTYALKQFEKGEKVNAYDDVRVNPLFSQSCAAAIWKIIEEDNYDTFNIAGKDIVSIYELLRKTAEVFGFDPELVSPVKQGFFNELVKRPKDTSFNTEKMRINLGIEPLAVTEGLNLMKRAGGLSKKEDTRCIAVRK